MICQLYTTKILEIAQLETCACVSQVYAEDVSCFSACCRVETRQEAPRMFLQQFLLHKEPGRTALQASRPLFVRSEDSASPV